MKHIFKKANFITETTPMYTDPEGNTPYKVKIETLPEFGELSYKGIPVTIGQVFDYTTQIGDGDFIYESELPKLEKHSVNFYFRVSDIGSELYSNIGVITFNIKKQQIPPTVDDNFDFLTTNKYSFKLIDFTNNYSDLNLDPYLKLVIENSIGAGFIKYNNIKVTAGTSILLTDINKLTFTLPDEYTIIDGILYMYDNGIDTIILQYEAAGYFLYSNENGVLIFRKQGVPYLTKEVKGEEIANSALSFNFSIIEDSEFSLKSNKATFSLIPQGNVNVAEPYINQPPTVGDLIINLDYEEDYNLGVNDFTTDTYPAYKDIENDQPKDLKITSLPTIGTIMYQGIEVVINQVIHIENINSLKYISDKATTTIYTDEFNFKIADEGSMQYSNQGKVTVNLAEKIASPPTVEDNAANIVDNIYNFKVQDFTKNFTDEDDDGYNETKIKTLPIVGDLNRNGNIINVNDTFPLTDISNVTFTLPGSYMLTPTGYCKFPKDIDTIIGEQQNDGYQLVNKTIGTLEFQKGGITQVPNDTDIYAFFDTTSMALSDAQSASSILEVWYNDYKIQNELFTGSLYIIPIAYERWVDYQDVLQIGTGTGKVSNTASETGNSAIVNQDWKDIAIYPPNFDSTTTNVTNTNWIPPTKALILAFVDEAENNGYHKDRNGYGFDTQPTSQYLEDYKRLKDNLDNKWDFLRGVFYPIPDIQAGNYNNVGNACVLQGFAAIEGGATYSLPEIEYLGVTFAEERRFHWHLDPNNSYYTGSNSNVANPYSPEANTSVPSTSYNLEGLKKYGWIGVYDKGQPASDVFNNTTFTNELDRFLQGNTINTIDKRIIEGDCTTDVSICFDFQTSDNSIFNYFSNTATFCLSPSDDNTSPTVSDNSAILRIKEYTFNNGAFIKNFSDPEGDQPNKAIIKELPDIGDLKLLGNKVNIGDSLFIITSNTLTFDLNDRYAIYNGILYDFGESITKIVNDYDSQGYRLKTNQDGKLTFESKSGSSNQSVVEGTIRPKSDLCFKFVTTDDSISNAESNTAKFCLIPEGDINIKETNENLPPEIGDNTLTTKYNVDLPMVQADFISDTNPIYSDPEGDLPYQLQVLSLPEEGKLLLGTQEVQVDDILNFGSDITTNKTNTNFKYRPNSNNTVIEKVVFRFAVSDIGSKQFVE
jgi:hypothetical protein